MELDNFDLNRVCRMIPNKIKEVIESEFWRGKIFIAGGFIRDLIAGDKINDVDLFVNNKSDAELLLNILKENKKVVKTDNAFTIVDRLPIQIIHRWTFDNPEDVLKSFDFTICSATVYIDKNGIYKGICDDRFYKDLASKRLIYMNPVREEAAGGSLIRVLKFYKRGYNIPLNNLSQVISRLMIDANKCYEQKDIQHSLNMYINAKLFEVDPLAINQFDDTDEQTTEN